MDKYHYFPISIPSNDHPLCKLIFVIPAKAGIPWFGYHPVLSSHALVPIYRERRESMQLIFNCGSYLNK
jgi:hypothetical protein